MVQLVWLREQRRPLLVFGLIGLLMLATAYLQSWSGMLDLLTVGAISAVMALGLNIQWGYAGLFNAGVMGFAAIGGFACVIVSMPAVPTAWRAEVPGLPIPAGLSVLLAWGMLLGGGTGLWYAYRRLTLQPLWVKRLLFLLALLLLYLLFRTLFSPAVTVIERSEGVGTQSKYLGGLGLPIHLAWLVGGLMAAGAASLIGRITLRLRADYLAIATLGISEIVIAALKNEGWLSRGSLNVNGLPPAVPSPVQLQDWGMSQDASLIFSKLLFLLLVLLVLGVALFFSVRALNAPWGRMMRAIRDREVAASALGKDVVARHRQVFVLGSFLLGVGGAMLASKVLQFTPGEYTPLRYTFVIWVMVIVGGSGNNLGAVAGAMLIWFIWIQAEPLAGLLFGAIGQLLPDAQAALLAERAPQMRTLVMGLILLLMLRFAPGGLLPERVRRS